MDRPNKEKKKIGVPETPHEDDTSSGESQFFSPNNSGFLRLNKRKEINSREELQEKKNYYSQFNIRESEITKDKRGLALKQNKENEPTEKENKGVSIGKMLITEKEGTYSQTYCRNG